MVQRHKRFDLGHELGVFFTQTIPKVAHDVGNGISNVFHDVGHIVHNIEKKAEGVVHDLHEDVKAVISVPKDIVQNAPQILQSAGTAVSTASQGIGKGLFSASPTLIAVAGLAAIILLRN